MVRQSMKRNITRWRGTAIAGALLLIMALAALHDPASQPSSLASGALDGGVLLYVDPDSKPGGGDRLFRVFPDGSGTAEIAFEERLSVERAILSPDGKRIAIQSRGEGNVGSIYVGNIGNSRLSKVPVDATHMGLEDWHPAGEDLLVWRFAGGQYDLIRLGMDGATTDLVTTPGVDERGGRWAPDGSRIAFLAPGEGGAMDVYVQSIGAGTPVNLSSSQEAEQVAEWSPDGERLLFRSGDQLVVVNVDGERQGTVPVYPAPVLYGWSPVGEVWLADDTGLVFSGQAAGVPLEARHSIGNGNRLVDWGMAGAPPLVITPGQIALSVEQGVEAAQTASVRLESGDQLETAWEASATAEWLTIEPNSGESPAEIQIEAATAGLAPGVHHAEIVFVPGDVRLEVIVAVNTPEASGQLVASPESLVIHGIAGGPNPPATSLAVTSSGDPVHWLASAPDAPWLRLDPAGTDTPGTLNVGVDTRGLTTGRYEAAISLLPGDIRVPVSLELIEPRPQAQLDVSPTVLSFVAIAGDAPPAGKRLGLARPDGSEAAWSAVTSAPWLRLSDYSGTTPDEIGVTVDTEGLEPGEYTGSIWAGQRSIPVALTVLDATGQEPAEAEARPEEATPTEAATPAPEQPAEAEPIAPAGADLVVEPAALKMAAIAGGPGAGDREIRISALNEEPVAWTITTSEPWLEVESTSGSTPATVTVSADISGVAPGTHQASLQIGDVTVPVELTVLEQAPADEAFEETWAYQDQPVDDELAPRTWLWGPVSSGTTYEEFAESPGGLRVVQYYDKSRMEITFPDADRDSEWYVTNGLLAKELITGRLQTGETSFEPHVPADLPVAGDTSDPDSPRYASFTRLLNAPAVPEGSVVVQTVDAEGNVSENPEFASYGVTVMEANAATGHSIADVFWDYLTSEGTVQDEFGYTTGPLFEPWFYATGLPITEPYWAEVDVGGTPHDVLIQCFERRCLTYTPANLPPWQVEQGNVGLHYFRWRYEQIDRG